MRVHWLQHVPFEGLGSIGPWLERQGAEVSMTRLYAGESPPTRNNFDWLIVMGGPMNIYQEAEYPWLIEEKLCIKRAIKQGHKVLGICLGAQLIADVLMSRVYKNPQREIGWFDVELTSDGVNSDIFGGFSGKFEAFHWHGDTFGVPEGAAALASSQACAHQAFVYNNAVVGLQFHLETTPESARALIEHCGDELEGGGDFVQSAEAMLADAARFNRLNGLMTRLLDNLQAAEAPAMLAL